MGWSDKAIEDTRKYLGSGGPVKCIDDRYGTFLGIADVHHDGSVDVLEYAKTGDFNDNGVVIASYSSVDEMIDDGWVID